MPRRHVLDDDGAWRVAELIGSDVNDEALAVKPSM